MSKSASAGTGGSPYELIGGEAGLRRLVNRFYDVMQENPAVARVRAMHAADLAPMRDKLFDYLSGWLGGPPLYMERQDSKCIMSAHAPYAIGEAERDEWLLCMRTALAESNLDNETRALFDRAFTRFADQIRTR